ncbi:MAG: radical SAM protein [Candidatus Thorarchaeota archaeon]|nr:radical SAM protein [Candidatus Thorarchaeota archaeon]
MRVSSIIDISLVDVPGIPVTTIFTAGCNFDCAFCQNSGLIPLESGLIVEIDDIVQRASGHLSDGFCITGGEPTIHRDLPNLLKALKKTEPKHMNLNTNGSVPNVLDASLQYLDSVWVDIKTTPSNYMKVARTKQNPWVRVLQSITLIMDSDVAFWPRTTYVGGLTTPEDILGIIQLLDEMGFKGEYVVQNYISSVGVRQKDTTWFYNPPRSELDPVLKDLPKKISLRLEWR